MGIIFDANEIHTMMNSMNFNMSNKILDIDDMKREIIKLISEDKLQGNAYDNGKEYFQMIWIPLLEGISKMCSHTIQANKEYMNDFHSQVDGSESAYIDTDYLEEGITRLNKLREIMDNDICKPTWLNNELYDNLYETRQLQNTINQLHSFDASAGRHYEEAKYYSDQVRSGMKMLSNGTWDEMNGQFNIDVTAMEWVGNILSMSSKNKENGRRLGKSKILENIKKKVLENIQKKQAKLVDEYWSADETRKKEIIKELRGYSISKNIYLDYPLYVDNWQMEILGWSKEYVTDDFMIQLNKTLKKYNITSTTQLRHFISQVSHESGYGYYLIEYGSEEYIAGNNYSGGPKYRGAGYIQLTHDYNYESFGYFVDDPEVLKQGYQYVADNYAWEAAGWFWSEERNLDEKINENTTVEEVTKKINGGYRGLEDRKEKYEEACNIIY